MRVVAVTVVRAAGWVLLAFVLGWLVAAATSMGRLGFVVGAVGLLGAVVVVPWLGDRWPVWYPKAGYVDATTGWLADKLHG